MTHPNNIKINTLAAAAGNSFSPLPQPFSYQLCTDVKIVAIYLSLAEKF